MRNAKYFNGLTFKFCYLFLSVCLSSTNIFSQPKTASPANWPYPDGNSQATRHITQVSATQDVNEFQIKWACDTLAGDVIPLIGNIIDNPVLFPGFPYCPNEITSVIGGNIIVIDATGKTHKIAKLPPFAKAVSVLFDTLQSGINSSIVNPVCLGIETVESKNLKDSLAFAYICSFDSQADTVQILKRLAIDLRQFAPNIFGSIKPVFGKKSGTSYHLYGSMNMSVPDTNTILTNNLAYFRGITQFNSPELKSFYPLNDIGDDTNSRSYLGYEVNLAQPSISIVDGTKQDMLLACKTDYKTDAYILDPKTKTSTHSNEPYIISVNMTGNTLTQDISPVNLSAILETSDSLPIIRPYYININDGVSSDSIYILIAEEYSGIEGSTGTPKLHLFSKKGDPLTLPADKIFGSPGLSPSIVGYKDHLWSIAVGDVDGDASNQLLPSYPNNKGNEIIATQSTREFVVPNNKLMVLRYNNGIAVPKKSPPNMNLNPFDTICTQRINGWLAAVNDIDGAPDHKEEIFIAEGSRLLILRLRDYQSYEFRDGRYFDTLKTFQFDNETIQSVEIADLEGDGKNDIIITTNDRTYLVGTKIDDKLSFVYPKAQSSPPLQFCVGDTVPLQWVNIMFRDISVRQNDTSFVNLYFRPYYNGTPADTMFLVRSGILNESDTINYKLQVDSLIFGLEGRFIAVSSLSPDTVKDSTAIVSFKYPGVLVDPLSRYTYYANEMLSLTGEAYCLDSVEMEYSYDQKTWVTNGTGKVSSGGTYSVSGQLPCAPFYECLVPDQDSILKVIVVAHKGDYSDTSAVLPIWLLPEPFPIVLEPCETACPSREFKWSTSLIDNLCDTVSVAIADINSSTYSEIARIPVSNQDYIWNIPVNVPEWIKVRFCCEGSCVRTDTILHDIKASYIGIVSPNPFEPPYQSVNVNYRVPKELYVTIRIYDQADRLVREIISEKSRQPDIVYCDSWDGRIWDGSLAANGMYYLSLELSDGQKEIYPVYVKK